MFKLRVAPMLALLFILFAQPAQAFFDLPYITPTAPMALEMVLVNIRSGVCDAVTHEQGYPQISREGNAIRILFWGLRYFNSEL